MLLSSVESIYSTIEKLTKYKGGNKIMLSMLIFTIIVLGLVYYAFKALFIPFIVILFVIGLIVGIVQNHSKEG